MFVCLLRCVCSFWQLGTHSTLDSSRTLVKPATDNLCVYLLFCSVAARAIGHSESSGQRVVALPVIVGGEVVNDSRYPYAVV